MLMVWRVKGEGRPRTAVSTFNRPTFQAHYTAPRWHIPARSWPKTPTHWFCSLSCFLAIVLLRKAGEVSKRVPKPLVHQWIIDREQPQPKLRHGCGELIPKAVTRWQGSEISKEKQ